MLMNFDNNWNLTGSKRDGRYTNLPGGTYTLWVKAANSAGIWNETSGSLLVKVIPPFWQTWLFRGFLVVVIAAVAAAFFVGRTRVINRRNTELETLVQRRTTEMGKLFEKTRELAIIEERNRLARDLHDSAKQKAFAALAQLGTAKGELKGSPGEAYKHIKEAETLVYEVIEELTFLIQEMYPAALKEKGLETILREYVYQWESRSDIPVNLNIDYPHRLALNVEQALYRAIQEALANIARHSGATAVELSLLVFGSEVTMIIQDNGYGFDTAKTTAGLGLRLIHERVDSIGGKLTIESSGGKGTRH